MGIHITILLRKLPFINKTLEDSINFICSFQLLTDLYSKGLSGYRVKPAANRNEVNHNRMTSNQSDSCENKIFRLFFSCLLSRICLASLFPLDLLQCVYWQHVLCISAAKIIITSSLWNEHPARDTCRCFCRRRCVSWCPADLSCSSAAQKPINPTLTSPETFTLFTWSLGILTVWNGRKLGFYVCLQQTHRAPLTEGDTGWSLQQLEFSEEKRISVH